MSVPPPPPRRSRSERRLGFGIKVLLFVALAAIVLTGVLTFLDRIRSVTVILIGATFFTYVIYPGVRRLNRRLPLVWSIALIYVAIFLVIGFGAAVVLPALSADAQSLVKSAPALVHSAQSFLTDANNPVVRRLPSPVRDYLGTLPVQIDTLAQQYAGEAAQRTLAFVLSAVSLAATVIVIPVLSIYLMFEWPALMTSALLALPPRARPKTRAILHDLDKVLGGFIRGQFTVGATIGVVITLMLLVMHVKYAVLIGVMAGLLDIIPYVGAIAAFLPSVILAFLDSGAQHAAVVAVLLVAIFQLEGHVIAPRIVSDNVGLSPLQVIVAILIGAELGGIAGMFLAVPIAAILRVLIAHVVPRYAADARLAAAEIPPAPVPPPPGRETKRAQGVRA